LQKNEGGYIRSNDGKLNVGGSIYYPSENGWHGPGGFIRLNEGKLFTPDGNIYYPSEK
jgi:hypothetical protein